MWVAWQADGGEPRKQWLKIAGTELISPETEAAMRDQHLATDVTPTL
jgi:hypothetical protein